MKAWSYRDRIAQDDLRLGNRPDPMPGLHDIVLRMRAVALNFRDLAIAGGTYHVGVAAPLVPLSDGAGEVVALGEGVTRFRQGDLACPLYLPDWIEGPISARVGLRRLGGPSDGVAAEFIRVHEDAAIRAPAHLTAEEAATLPVAGVTAWHTLQVHGTLRPGATVLTYGTGGVALAVVQIARMGGARAIAIVRSARHVERLRELGAEVVVTADSPDWRADVVNMTNWAGIDVVADTLGGEFLAHSISLLGAGGIVHLIGYAAGTTAAIDIFDAIRHAATIKVATAGHRASFEAYGRALELSGMRPVVGEMFAFEDLHRAMDRLAAGGNFGKIVLRLD